MKKILILLLFFVIACGPSEEEIQASLDNAVEQATSINSSTTTSSTTTTPVDNKNSNPNETLDTTANESDESIMKLEKSDFINWDNDVFNLSVSEEQAENLKKGRGWSCEGILKFQLEGQIYYLGCGTLYDYNVMMNYTDTGIILDEESKKCVVENWTDNPSQIIKSDYFIDLGSSVNIALLPMISYTLNETERANLPSTEYLYNSFLADDSIVNKYLYTVSNSKFKITGTVFEYTILDVPFMKSGEQETWIRNLSKYNFQIKNFDDSNFDIVVPVFIDNNIYGSSMANAFFESFLVNDSIVSSKNFILFGTLKNDAIGFSNTFNNFNKGFAIPTVKEFIELSIVSPFTESQRTFVHELFHTLYIKTHALSRTSNGIPHYLDSNPEINRFFTRDYGDFYDIMGTSEYSFQLNTGYRDFFGWIEDQKIRIDNYETKTFTLYPITNASELISAEIRIPYKYALDDYQRAAQVCYENAGYYLEVRNSSDIYAPQLKNKYLSSNSEGIQIRYTDGYSTFLLDASPSKNIIYDWGEINDITDVVLKPGNFYEDEYVKIENIKKNQDGSFTLTVTVKQ